ncbi:acyl-CoA dehydrogenase family protein [Rhodococcus sp. NPDC058521]|uniref:acyl-CoA dehydrogenase family protein n=1 Tax=Rhodococcus sp. NPDC058521 TaxID=3346536 RepID=UPI00365ADE91
MDFTLTEAQQDLAGLTRGIVGDLVTNERLRELEAEDDLFDARLWATLASSDVLSAALPESVDGDGFGVLEQCAVLIELGRALAPVPYLSSIVMATGAVAEFGDAKQVSEWGVPAARGERISTVALAEEVNENPGAPVTVARREADAWVLTGTKILVDAAPIADLFLVPATSPDGVTVFLVHRDDNGVGITRQDPVDHASTGEVSFQEVRLTDDRVLGEADRGSEIVKWIVERGTLGSCAFQYGVLDRALELTAEYARERVQFGRPIGSFQAVAQRLADAYIDVKGVRLTLWQAAWQTSENFPAEGSVHTAKFWASEAGHRVAHTVIHVHGGVGLDEDHPVHRYFLAAKAHEFGLGSATHQLRALGEVLASVPA